MLRVIDQTEAAVTSIAMDLFDNPVTRARHLSTFLFDQGSRIDAEASIGPAVFDALTRSRLPLSVFPTDLGGDGLLLPARSRGLADVLRQIGAGDLSVARLFEGHANAVALVARYGTPKQLRDLAERVRDGALSAVWNAEGRLPLSAERDGDVWHCSGQKILASGAGTIICPIVTAATDAGRIMLMPKLASGRPADLTAWTPQGMRASATGTVDLSGLAIAVDDQIGAPDTYMRQPMFSGGAWRFCAVHLGAAERLLDLFREHLRRTDRGGDPYQKQRIATCVTAVTTASLWIEKAAERVAAEDGTPETIVAFVNLTRGVTERACLDVLEAVHRGVGLGGFMRPNPIERLSRDLATYLRQPVPDAAMADAAATVLASDASSFDLWTA